MAECAPLIIGGKDKTVLSKNHSKSITDFNNSICEATLVKIKDQVPKLSVWKKVQLTENKVGAISTSLFR